jgi:hypothetical protein
VVERRALVKQCCGGWSIHQANVEWVEPYGPLLTIGKDVAQLGEAPTERAQQGHGTVIVLNVGGVH